MLRDAVALIAGASGGLGWHIALSLAQEGAKVICHYHRGEARAHELLKEIRGVGSQAVIVQADVTNETSIQAAVQQGIERFERLDILVNSLGISRDGISWQLDESDWTSTIQVNLTGAFLFCKHVLPHMRKQSYGRIINISSVVGQMGVVGTAAYTASKAGLFGFTKTLAKEVVKQGITVNCLALGYFEEGMFLALKPETQAAILAQIPMGRLGRPSEVVHTIKFLCSDEAAYITGQTISINGGIYM